MSFLQSALRLAEYGFYVFPCVPGGKTPMDSGWQQIATRDPEKIRKIWYCEHLDVEQPYNIGILTTKFKDGRPLLVVDIDNKDGKDGDGEILKLELAGKELPDTFTTLTPTGGRHLVYYAPFSVGNSSHRLAPGVDTRGHGGIAIGHGSEVLSGVYSSSFAAIAEAPLWLVQSLSEARKATASTQSEKTVVNEEYAERRGRLYLERAPIAISGSGGNHTTFRVAAHLKDLGVSSLSAYELMQEWNEKCQPPWSDGELTKIIENAYAYGKEVGGVAAPEADFQPVIADDAADKPETVSTERAAEAGSDSEAHSTNPVENFNKEFAFVIAGRNHAILWETIDEDGNFELKLISEEAFHKKFEGQFFFSGDGKGKPITRAWLASASRRSFDKIVFKPGKVVPSRFYNLWRGFSVPPADDLDLATTQQKDSLEAFLSHAKENVCGNSKELFHWLMSYFAHLVQRPWERPDVAVVFRGKKGVGKNALIERVGHLLGQHFGVAANQRYLAGNFNAHFENKLMFVLDEAFWSGDKNVEGILKHLVTGTKHNIERKGQEAYTVDNCIRVIIFGNEDWIVPASEDERRYAVFDVGTARKEDRKFFREMRKGMEAGGYSLLLRYLMDYDISDFEPGFAPKTEALLDQKINSLNPFGKWWYLCLKREEIVGSEFLGDQWPKEVLSESFRDAYHRHVKSLGVRWVADDATIGRYLKLMSPLTKTCRTTQADGGRARIYLLPTLEKCRKEFEDFIGHAVNWEAP